MPVRIVPLLILAAGLAVVGYGILYRRRNPPHIVATSKLTLADPASGQTIQFSIRTIEMGSVRLEEVQLPGGTWIDCGGDCRETVLREHLEFWPRRMLEP
jgi:hypothetical protein